jgi:hypothetical protein
MADITSGEASRWADLIDADTTVYAECGACSWRARGTGKHRVREIVVEANEHSTLHPCVSVELDHPDPPEPGDG